MLIYVHFSIDSASKIYQMPGSNSICLLVLKLFKQVLRLHKQDFETFCHYTLCTGSQT